MPPTDATERRRTGDVHALALYETDAGRRVLVAQRVEGVVRLTDSPLDPSGHRLDPGGRSYPVEPAIASATELRALVADYRAYARRHGECPMRASAVNLLHSSRLREAVS